MQHNVLILAGSAEARELAAQLAEEPAWRTISSFAGRTASPKLPAGEVRSGGFGGAVPLAQFLRDEQVAAVVDATHPFAVGITRNAIAAAQTAGVPLLRLNRPPWVQEPGDLWFEVTDWPDAIPLLKGGGHRVFLAIGRQELQPFRALPDCFFLVRTVDAPEEPMPLQRYESVTGRGPFPVEDEIELLQRYGITHVVCKNSGGTSAAGKLKAARELGLPVIIKRRPPALPSPAVRSVGEAIGWLNAVCG